MTDSELLERFLDKHDPECFAELVRRHGGLVARVCRGILGDSPTADDAFQATFLVLLQNARSIRDWDALGRWLYGVASRIAIRAKRRRAAEPVREHPRIEMVADHRASDTGHPEVAPELHEELARLPSLLRDPIVLCYFEDLSCEEAARRLGRPLGTVKHQLTRGRSLLRDRLKRRGVTVSAMFLMFLLTRRVDASTWDVLVPETTDLARLWAIHQPVPSRISTLVDDMSATLRPTRRRATVVLFLAALMLLGSAWLISGGVSPSFARGLFVNERSDAIGHCGQ